MQKHTKTPISHLINEINRLRDLVDKDRFSISELEAELKRNQWQPIETAPKDGTRIYAGKFGQRTGSIVRWKNGERKQGWHDGISFCLGRYDVWMLPPTPPANTEGGV